MKMEIANHEYWSADGQWLCYDCETPMNEVFWVASYNVYTGERVWYHLTLDQWSIHYNRSPDGTLYSGDGGEPGHLGPQPPHSKWIYLFHPHLVPDLRTPSAQAAEAAEAGPGGLTKIGYMETEKLVNLRPLLLPRTQQQLHPRRQMDRLPLQHARSDPGLRRRGRQGQ
jgi:oligogalacturonide lyase